VFPLRDENPTDTTPFVTMFIIAVNLLVWLAVEGAGANVHLLQEAVCRYGTIPAELTGATGGFKGIQLGPGYVCQFGGLTWATLFTSMFLHGSWLHIIGNMWFLWIFGNNIEDSMGHIRYVFFYLLTGLLAGGAHVLSATSSLVPTIGASGAISGVMGAYLLLYPRVRIYTLFFFFIFVRIFAIPAWVVLLEWLLIQVLSGATTSAAGGGVAFWAHVGGFAAGVLLIRLFERPEHVAARKALGQLHHGPPPGGSWQG
jgi:membrane associated rhomboid family serine protease